MSEIKKEDVKEAAGREKAEKKQTARKGEEGTVIYAGPSIKNVVSANTIFCNGVSEALNKEIEKRPIIKNLIVPVSRLADVQKELKIKGSAIETIYKKVKEGQEEG